jgi:hypothetical protein
MAMLGVAAMGRHLAVRVLTFVLTAVLGLGILPGMWGEPIVQGQQTPPAQQTAQAQGLKTTVIPAGGTATLQVRAYCLDFGKPFPTQPVMVRGLGDQRVRGALNYAIQNGYSDGNSPQVQLAIWYLRDNTWHAAQHTLAQEIVDNALVTTPLTGTATSLVDAVAQNSVTVTGTFTPQTPEAFYGDGEITIQNNLTTDISIYMPVGVAFEVPDGSGRMQALLGYELGAEQVAVNGTPVTGATPSLTVTSIPTVQPTLTAILTPIVTGTVASGTTPSPAGTTVAETPTSAPSTPTTAAQPTETPAPAPATPTAAPTPSGDNLPGTGQGDIAVLSLLALAAGIVSIGMGLVLQHRRRD